jgi:hypothetical protein
MVVERRYEANSDETAEEAVDIYRHTIPGRTESAVRQHWTVALAPKNGRKQRR